MFVGLVLVLLLGIFIGIDLDWATWLAKSSPEKLVTKSAGGAIVTGNPSEIYDLEGDKGDANLVVQEGETISLSRKGGGAGGSTMDFGNDSPCDVSGKVSTCTIKQGAKRWPPYHFTCDATGAYMCKDPGLQVRTGSLIQYELEPISFPDDLESIARYLRTSKRPPLDIELLPAVQNPGNKP
jgi:hypothetical protein